MPRGGVREGAGSKPTWKHGKTKPIRVPEVLAEVILKVARIIDESEKGLHFLQTLEKSETQSKVIDLSGISIRQSKDGPVVRLADLMKAGYEITPNRLVRNIQESISKEIADKKDLDSFLEEFL